MRMTTATEAKPQQEDEVMRHLAQTLDAIKDMLDRGNGR